MIRLSRLAMRLREGAFSSPRGACIMIAPSIIRCRRESMKRAIKLIAGLALFLLPAYTADQWSQFRGVQAGVAADDPALPESWSETENILWKIDVPGLGWSSPVVWDDHIFITSAVSSGNEPAPSKGLYDPGDDHGKTKA